ncbi:hypothetical protein [Desulfoscipio gibsoniae]|uniref:Uncharacterized protein n=1 Tax=Desulfoscipio gibsoniae DSM 7213 TaxID=767817 RepID=R4KJL2_9FIRM|nr:hypothetical protein [Desulfoscipio gibsoniae]AGL00715.1 hypothetical protein Desgi_1192 [Desulfoscipio gibsoniae DSM 7213]
MMPLNEDLFLDTFNQQWCWRVVRMVHVGKCGDMLDFPAVLAGIVAGRAGDGNFSKITRESKVPWGSYLYMQSVIKSSQGKPAYTRLFIDITDDMLYDAQPGRALIINNREVAAFFPASEQMADDFLRLNGTVDLIRQLCDQVGKDQSAVGILS